MGVLKETDKKLDRLEKQVKETSKTLEKQIKETSKTLEKQIKETSKTVKETSRAVYDLTGKWGRFVEGLIIPAAERLFKERGIEVEQVHQRVKVRRNGTKMEIDILVVNGECRYN